jgi:hypothetical protein
VKKFLFAIIIIELCFGRHDLKTELLDKNGISFNSKQEFVQVGHINEFVLDQGHPFKKPSAFVYAVIQQGKLKDFILDHGYPSKIKASQTLSKFKIIREY